MVNGDLLIVLVGYFHPICERVVDRIQTLEREVVQFLISTHFKVSHGLFFEIRDRILLIMVLEIVVIIIISYRGRCLVNASIHIG